MGAILPIAALALSAAGTGVSMAGAAATRAAMEKKAGEEVERQREYQRRAADIYAASLQQEGVPNAEAKMAAARAQAEATTQRLQALPAGVATLPPQQNSTVGAQQVAAQNAMLRTRMANMYAPTDWQLQQWIKNLQANQLLAIQMRNAQASAGILGPELQTAQHAGDSLQAAGTGLSMAGQVAGLGSLAFPAQPATATAGAAKSANTGFVQPTGAYPGSTVPAPQYVGAYMPYSPYPATDFFGTAFHY